MTSQQLTTEALALPISERISLAQTLWQSIDSGWRNADPGESLREAIRRDQEMTSKAVVGRTHEEVMSAARRAI
jgi:putative addiction module component (TIGR02574 family)